MEPPFSCCWQLACCSRRGGRAARKGLEVLASAKSLRAAEKELAQPRSPVARFVKAAAGEADRSGCRNDFEEKAPSRQRPRDRSACSRGFCSALVSSRCFR